ncbi:hypothetical protein Rfer_4215 [Rhodoferax ferrireducens T118]|uniref:DUF3800 domain-containing protein n=1 Tax=Albidiferax ferrireducens (strain ATCC BAA-621 / DSM 15236 / T118) TaxID=338969 RepID=Q21QQ1_ALBFT|nr:DUF3800 domain-containing protein [Rhodoferax ferrireducens]ABD71902.1 hypothetical protein Rfer_4215 [Rhodoferax ferrireducens T118]
MAQKIYFDESGFTGNNLLAPDQRFFAYASVATDDAEARIFVDELIAKYGIQGGELKGSKLVKFNKGRKAIDEILLRFGDRIKISISEKKFALACKFHEYIFEPCYSDANSLFYGIGFHRFIANILYLEFVARGAGAEQIFAEFEELIRNKDETKLPNIFSSSAHPENSPILTQVREFAQYRSDDIRRELESLGDTGVGKWALDLTNSALFTLLANWGTTHPVLTAVCDPSKPLQQNQGIFNAMVGRTGEQIFSDLMGERHPITFNLSEPLVFSDSKSTHGIQIADAVAAAAVYTFSDARDEHTEKWRPLMGKIAHYGSIIPDHDEVSLRDRRVQRNALVLLELHSRAKNGQSLIDGMGEFMQLVGRRLLTHPLGA